MALAATELTFLEHIAPRYNIPVPRHLCGESPPAVVKKALESWGGTALVKPDVLSGRRGKAGAVISVSTPTEALRAVKKVSGMEIGGEIPRAAYLVEVIPSQLEIFTSITYDTVSMGPCLTISLKGGVGIEEIDEDGKAGIQVDVFQGLDAYQVSDALIELGCRQELISTVSRALISFWDMFISTGMQSAEVNPWRVTPEGAVFACDFKATFDEHNYKSRIPGMIFPEYPTGAGDFEEEMRAWDASSHQGQAHVTDLHGSRVLPLLFGGGASTIIIETLDAENGSPLFLSDFGGNPPYERMYGTAKRCFDHRLRDAELLLILGGKANNTFIDVTFQAIADALVTYSEENGPVDIPVVIGRGGPRLVKGMLAMKKALDCLQLPYVIFGPDTPVTLVAEYAAKLAGAAVELKEEAHAG